MKLNSSGLLSCEAPSMRYYRRVCTLVIIAIAAITLGCQSNQSASGLAKPEFDMQPLANLGDLCSGAVMQGVADGIAGGITIKTITNGPRHVAGTKYFPTNDVVPEFCQVTGSFVTNPEAGKTANFLATFPAHWNGKYLQMGCSGHCGQFAVSDVAMPFATITNQGYPYDPIKRGYAVFATDEGHEGMSGGTWAIKGPNRVDEEAIEDFLQRATKTLATVGKQFTTAFYDYASNSKQSISYSYFNGCSGGGRDALVAATHYPEAFDGIIAGSPYNGVGAAFQMAAVPLASIRTEAAFIPPALIGQIDAIVKSKCDATDGVKDGLIQNPAACDFRPEHDLPRCERHKTGGSCFTDAQIETLSVALSAVTDEKGNVIQPGFSVSEIQAATFLTPPRPADPKAKDPFPGSDTGSLMGGYWPLADAMLKVFVHKNDPEFFTRELIEFQQGGDGEVTAYRAVAPQEEYELAKQVVAKGIGHAAEGYRQLMDQGTKLLMWHNLSDQTLTPYMSINLYKQMAKIYGGYDKLQEQVRLFTLPGTGHCSMMGVGPNTFDALGAMEKWIEEDIAPNSLVASEIATNAMGLKVFDKPPVRTMPLCKFPEMARYKGEGDVNSADNWECPEGDTRMLEVGASGKQAGVIE